MRFLYLSVALWLVVALGGFFFSPLLYLAVAGLVFSLVFSLSFVGSERLRGAGGNSKARVAIALLLGLALAGALFLSLPLWLTHFGGERLAVPRGASARGVYQGLDLAEKGIVYPQYRLWHALGRWLYGPYHSGIYAGESRLYRMFLRIHQGQVLRFVVPEGWRQKEIAQHLGRRMGKPHHPYLQKLSRLEPNHEGRLFPSTYRLDSTEPEAIVAKMLKLFARKNRHWHLTSDELILASLIQKEGRHPEEFRRIAGVFVNRLEQNMKLESDPTLKYVLGPGKLTKKDLKLDSPFNTYRYKGLPPTPIANPGEQAIRAALEPKEHDYYYFVAKGDGYHYFSESRQEHLLATGYYILKLDNGFPQIKDQFD